MNEIKKHSDTREKAIYKVTLTGSAVNVLLLVTKFVAGILGSSAAMIADAIHSLSDFLTDILVVLFVHISNKPRDKKHDYGHGKYETLATLVIGLILFFVGLGIFQHGASAVYRLLYRNEKIESPGMVAFITALLSIVLKEILFQYTLLKGKELNSQSVIANAWHHRSDAFSSIGTAAGIGGAILLGEKWVVLDPVAAIVVSIFICKVSVQLMIPSFGELLEESLPEETENKLLGILNDFPEVSDPHNLRTRRIGNYCAVEIHIRMDGTIPLTKAHDTASKIENRMKDVLGASSIINIHLEPKK